MVTPSLSERTDTLMIDLKLDQVGLARFAGVTKGAVNQWKNSKPSATMKPSVAYAISDKTDYEPRWLILGEGKKLRTNDHPDHGTDVQSASQLRKHGYKRLVIQRLCDLAESMADEGVERLIEHADGLVRKYPLKQKSRAKRS